jgi:hypothetical protein
VHKKPHAFAYAGHYVRDEAELQPMKNMKTVNEGDKTNKVKYWVVLMQAIVRETEAGAMGICKVTPYRKDSLFFRLGIMVQKQAYSSYITKERSQTQSANTRGRLHSTRVAPLLPPPAPEVAVALALDDKVIRSEYLRQNEKSDKWVL